MKTVTKLWIGIIILIALSPVGLLLPEHFKAGDAWGEWGTDGVQELIGYIPAGLAKLSSVWSAPLPDYGFKGADAPGAIHASIAYLLSAAMGIAAVVVVMLMLGKILSRRNK